MNSVVFQSPKRLARPIQSSSHKLASALLTEPPFKTDENRDRQHGPQIWENPVLHHDGYTGTVANAALVPRHGTSPRCFPADGFCE
jgi:hypothetical protein